MIVCIRALILLSLIFSLLLSSFFFFFNAPATTEIYTLSLHDALPISVGVALAANHVFHFTTGITVAPGLPVALGAAGSFVIRSEEHTSELQSHSDLVCRLLLEKKKKKKKVKIIKNTMKNTQLQSCAQG